MKLKKAQIQSLKELIKDIDLIKKIKAGKKVLILSENGEELPKEQTDPLVNFEVSLEKCNRLGIFKK